MLATGVGGFWADGTGADGTGADGAGADGAGADGAGADGGCVASVFATMASAGLGTTGLAVSAAGASAGLVAGASAGFGAAVVCWTRFDTVGDSAVSACTGSIAVGLGVAGLGVAGLEAADLGAAGSFVACGSDFIVAFSVGLSLATAIGAAGSQGNSRPAGFDSAAVSAGLAGAAGLAEAVCFSFAGTSAGASADSGFLATSATVVASDTLLFAGRLFLRAGASPAVSDGPSLARSASVRTFGGASLDDGGATSDSGIFSGAVDAPASLRTSG